MPELPEVEASRQILHAALAERRITGVEFAPDEIVLEGRDPDELAARFTGQTVTGTGRHGKFFWLETSGAGALMGHLGMSGAVLDLTPGHERGVNYKQVRAEVPADGRPRFLKLWLETADGRAVAMVDGRRLGRLWPSDNPLADPRVVRMGPDAHTALPDPEALHAMTVRRRAPVKAVLLDQSFLAGIGNYLADEILYAARIAPGRLGASLSREETDRLHAGIATIVGHAVAVDADYERFPESWLFHVRWGGARGETRHEGRPLVRETIGGRTTAWVPGWQQ